MKKLITILSIISILLIGAALSTRAILFPLQDKETIQKYAHEYDINASLIASFINFETNFNPIPYSEGMSVGYMKIKDVSAESFSKEMNITNFDKSTIADTDTNIKIGTYYLSKYKDSGIQEMVGKWGIRNGIDPNDPLDIEAYYKKYHVEKIKNLDKYYKLLYPLLNK